jgi:hypothetical protein
MVADAEVVDSRLGDPTESGLQLLWIPVVLIEGRGEEAHSNLRHGGL